MAVKMLNTVFSLELIKKQDSLRAERQSTGMPVSSALSLIVIAIIWQCEYGANYRDVTLSNVTIS